MNFTRLIGGKRVKHLTASLLAGILAIGIFSLPTSSVAQGAANPTRTEMFRVSRVQNPSSAENQETLLSLYEVVASEYNERIRREQSTNPQLYEGDRVRILRDLGQGGAGNLFLVAYNGGPVVFEVSGDTSAFDPGELSPALLIGEQSGQHSVEVTRTITVKDPKQPEPQLETVEETGAVTFFGIAIPGTGSGGGGGGSNSSSKKATGGGSRKQEITETEMMPKYAANVSTKRHDGGPQTMTTTLFTSQLKNGELFTVTRAEQRRCQECRGFKRVKTDKPIGFRDPDGKMDCPECQARGTIDWQVTYKITW